ncbi:hypothetical protein LJR230_004025 [Trinickia sp. LjRoot230]|uniref:hypothetical protein n=1 Tax=Trinickia sp. LjRoot230 TaxID=3342288 RepID=UPI003ECCDB2B
MTNRIGPSDGAPHPDNGDALGNAEMQEENLSAPSTPSIDPQLSALQPADQRPAASPPESFQQRRALLPKHAGDDAKARQAKLIEDAGQVTDLTGVTACVGYHRVGRSADSIRNLPEKLQAEPLAVILGRLRYMRFAQRPQVFMAILSATRALHQEHQAEPLKALAYGAIELPPDPYGLRDDVLSLARAGWLAEKVSTTDYAEILSGLARSQSSLQHDVDFVEMDKIVDAIKELPQALRALPLANMFSHEIIFQPRAVQEAAFNRAWDGLAELTREQAEPALPLLASNIFRFEDRVATWQAIDAILDASQHASPNVCDQIISEMGKSVSSLPEPVADEMLGRILDAIAANPNSTVSAAAFGHLEWSPGQKAMIFDRMCLVVSARPNSRARATDLGYLAELIADVPAERQLGAFNAIADATRKMPLALRFDPLAQMQLVLDHLRFDADRGEARTIFEELGGEVLWEVSSYQEWQTRFSEPVD